MSLYTNSNTLSDANLSLSVITSPTVCLKTLKAESIQQFNFSKTLNVGKCLIDDSCGFTVGSVLSNDGYCLPSVLQCCGCLFVSGHAQVHAIYLTCIDSTFVNNYTQHQCVSL